MIAVIGAGPAGLALAWRLTRAGHAVVVLEAADRVGGMAGSRTISGQRVDLGRHRLHPAMAPEVRSALEELVELQERPCNGRVRIGDRWLPVPLTLVGLGRGLGARNAMRAAIDALTGPLRSPGTDTHADVVRRLARDVHSTPTYLYPRRGFGALCEAMAELVPDVRLRTKVTGLIEHDDRVIVGLADGRIVTASHVFSTLSMGRTASWLGLAEPAQVAMPMRSVVLVYLTVAGRPYTPFDTHDLPDRTVLPTRVSEPANHRSSAADPPATTVLCAEIPCGRDDGVWRATDTDLGRRVADDLVRSGLPDPAVEAVDVIRLPSVHPVLTSASLAAFDRADAAMARSSRVTVLGRHGLFTSDDTHHVIEMGFAAAACVRADGRFDRAAWREARDQFREFAVEE